ncbi:MAG: hypothetical protein Q4E43_05305 [Akkermansia sp.]|nr:hypothetical protein [Akkermansia sp.]
MATATFDEQHARWVLRYRVPSPRGTCYRYGHKRVSDMRYTLLDEAAQTRRRAEMERRAEQLERAACGEKMPPAVVQRPAQSSATARLSVSRRRSWEKVRA